MATLRVFISYSSQDGKVADYIKARLAEASADVWLDHERLRPGTKDWQESVRDGIANCDYLIYVASETAVKSQFVGGEIALATAQEKTIISFWVRGANWRECAPIELIRSQYVDGRSMKLQSGMAELLRALGLPAYAPSEPWPRNRPPVVLWTILLSVVGFFITTGLALTPYALSHAPVVAPQVGWLYASASTPVALISGIVITRITRRNGGWITGFFAALSLGWVDHIYHPNVTPLVGIVYGILFGASAGAVGSWIIRRLRG